MTCSDLLSFHHAPGGAIRPRFQRSGCPLGQFVGVAEVTGIGNLEGLCFARGDKAEGVAADVLIGDRLLDLRHMASDALAAGAAWLMMSVLFEGCGVGSDLRVRTMAIETKRVAGFAHHGNVVAAMRVMAAKAGHPACIHEAPDKIVALHAVLVAGAVREMRERRCAELVLFKLPVVYEVLSDFESDRPIVVFSLDRVGERLPLGVTLNAGVVRVHVVGAGRIEDVVAGRAGRMRFTGAVTFLAADVSLGWGLGGDVEIHRVTAVAQRGGRPLEIVGRVKRGPPIRAVGDKVGPP